MSLEPQDALRDAIARNCAAVLSLPSAGMLRHFKSRFLTEDVEGFWMESVPGQAGVIDELIATQSRVGVAFKTTTTKVLFASTLLERDESYQVNANLKVEALLLPYPQEIKVVQRRANYRVQISAEAEIGVHAWRIPEHAVLRDRPAASMEVPLRLRDLSIGGMGILCPAKDREPIKLAADQRLRVSITWKGLDVLVEGRVRHMQVTPDRSLRAGVQFRKLEEDVEGRQMLARLTSIVGQLHREEVRRARLGLTG